jgi:hypothetical protein
MVLLLTVKYFSKRTLLRNFLPPNLPFTHYITITYSDSVNINMSEHNGLENTEVYSSFVMFYLSYHAMSSLKG